MDGLKKQIEDGALRSLYLFYGDETYLLETYHNRLLRSMMEPEDEMMNYDEMQGRVAAEQIMNSAETFPLMTEKRLVVVRDSGAFETDGNAAYEPLVGFFSQLPDTVVLVFIESHVDKRSRLYKAAQKYGYIVEFTTLRETDLCKWLMIEAKRRHLKMDIMTAQYFLHLAGTDMNLLNQEMEKVFAYKEGCGVILREDLERIVTPSLETNVFRMMDAIGNQQAQEAFRIYQNLRRVGENAYMIFALLRRQIDLLYKTSVYLAERYDANTIAKTMNVKPFIAKKNMAQARKFSREKLREAMSELLQFDVDIKNGVLKPEQVIELMITKYGSKMASAAMR